MEDLEDDIEEQQVPQDDLFGDEEDEAQQAGDGMAAGLEDEEDEDFEPAPAPARPVVEAAPVQSAEDRRAALLKLAKKKREADTDGEPRKKKKKKGDKGDKEGSGRPSRRREARAKPAERPPRAAGAAANEPELPSDELDEEDADKDFIDDEGVQVDEEVQDDDPGTAALLLPPEEAVEVARGEEDEAADDEDPFGHKKRKRRKETDQQMAMVVDDNIAKMEAAVEADMEQHEQSKPAIQKLKFLKEVEDFLAQKKYHELFVSAGGLGVLKAWLEPYSDGSLPNTRVRTAILKACQLLPIDTSREDMKAQLKKSQLGNRVMFLLKCQDETQANKQLARELVQRWSRPIFHDPQMEAEKRRVKEEQLKAARAAAVEAQREREAQQAATQRPKVKFGEAGYRWHASIPTASKLDYVVEPRQDEREGMAQAAAAAAAVPASSSRFAKKMREVQRKQKSTTARAAKPSVEGRTITIMNH